MTIKKPEIVIHSQYVVTLMPSNIVLEPSPAGFGAGHGHCPVSCRVLSMPVFTLNCIHGVKCHLETCCQEGIESDI